MPNEKLQQYIWLAGIFVVIFILFIVGFYYFVSKEDKITTKVLTSNQADEWEKVKLACEEEVKLCGQGQLCPLPSCLILNGARISKKTLDGNFSDSGQSGSNNNPSNPPNPPNPPGPDNPPIEPYMNSEKYKIAWDSINGGGGLSASANYSSESTVGEIATGYSSSEIYFAHAGYQQNEGEETYISLEVDYATVVLTTGGNGIGNFLDGVTGGIVSAEHNWTVTTNNTSGYTLALKQTTGAKSGGGTNGALTNTGGTSFEFLPISATTPTVWPTLSAGATGFGYSLSNLTGSATAAADWSGKTDGTYFVKIGTSDYNLLDNSGPSNPSGDGVRVNWKAELVSGGSQYLLPGTYKEFVTLTGQLKP